MSRGETRKFMQRSTLHEHPLLQMMRDSDRKTMQLGLPMPIFLGVQYMCVTIKILDKIVVGEEE